MLNIVVFDQTQLYPSLLSLLFQMCPLLDTNTWPQHSVLAKLHPITFYRISGECAVPGLNATFCFLWFTNGVLLFDKSLILGCLWPLVFVLNNTLILGICVIYNPSPPRMFLFLDLLSEYRIQHGTNGPLYVTSTYSIWIFCRGVSGFATDCPCGVWYRGLTTCLLHVGHLLKIEFYTTVGL